MQSTNQLVREIKRHNQDYEFYPTTSEIIDVIKRKINDRDSILDVGAGDGRVLNALTKGDKFAIEKSRPLLSALNADIFVVGTDFHEQTLLDKRCDVVFSNPPYSEFEYWAEKIILEAQAKAVYLVIPSRWAKSVVISDAITARKAEAKVLHSTDFLDADRKARATVDVIEVKLNRNSSRYSYNGSEPTVDPFELWFESNFPLVSSEDERLDVPLKEELSNALVSGNDIVSTLEQLYQRDFEKLLSAYKAVSNIDANILKELDVDRSVLAGGLRKKAEGLKDRYWRLLFENLDNVTNRLTATSRNSMFEVLTKNTHIDFTKSNAYAVLEWVVKNANLYYDQQLIDTYERMVEKANVTLYKSNQRVFGDDDWRYSREPEGLSHYKLELRVVLARIGGLDTYWSYRKGKLTERAEKFVNDLCTIAYNLGFDTWGMERADSFSWESGKKCKFHYKNHEKNSNEVLFEVKAFKNGNLHVKFSKSLICKINVEFGRLKGWLKNKAEAASELEIPTNDVSIIFGCNKQIEVDSVFKLEYSKAA